MKLAELPQGAIARDEVLRSPAQRGGKDQIVGKIWHNVWNRLGDLGDRGKLNHEREKVISVWLASQAAKYGLRNARSSSSRM